MVPLVARTFFRIQERLLGRRSFGILRELERTQRWPRERLEELRLTRLGEVLRAAYDHTPYWRSLMDEHRIGPDRVRSFDDLRRFPLLVKETLRQRRQDMVWAQEGPRLHLTRTSGSTNEALQFYTNSNREAHISAARMRGHGWVGICRGQKEMYFWGSPVELSKQDRLKQVRDFFINDGLTNGFELTPQRVAEYLAYWGRWRPCCIFGYPSSLVLMVNMGRAQSLDFSVLKARGLKNVITTSEVLSDVDRRIVSEAFGVPVYDSYGVREGGLIGHECACGTMHTIDEQLFLETVDPQTLQPTTGEGELVLTNLVSRVMPIIRYRTGDIVRLCDDLCPCGLTLRSVQVTGGRAVDFIVTRQGKWVVGYSFIYIARSVEGIVKFQVLQDKLGELRVLLVTDRNFPPDGVDRVAKAVSARLGSDDRIVVEIVHDIAPSPSGKYRPAISKVAQEMRAAGVFTPGD